MELRDVASNCRLAEGTSSTQSIDVWNGRITTLKFDLACEPTFPDRLPPGSQLAFVRNGGIHLVNSDGSGMVSLTSGPSDCDPSWSPDGKRIAFVRGCGGDSPDIYVMDGDRSNVVRRTYGGFSLNPAWSPDGSRIAFAARHNGSLDLYLMNGDADGKQPTLLLSFPGWKGQPAWSPDGRRVAFVSDKEFYDFLVDVFIVDLTDKRLTQVTRASSEKPFGEYYELAWSPDGTTLAVARCKLEFLICGTGTLVLLRPDGSALHELAAIEATRSVTWSLDGSMGSVTWSPDGSTLAFSALSYVGWITAAGNQRGFIVAEGHSPRVAPP